MNKKQYFSILLATVISGLVGGAGFNRLFLEQKVSTQKNSPEVITALEFRLVDKDGNLRAILSENPTVAGGTTPSLVLYDQNKKARLAVGSFKTNVPTIQLFDENEMSAILLNRADDRSNLILSQSSLKQDGNSVERKSFAALWLTQTPIEGANIGIMNEDLKLVWSARKFKLPWENIK